MKKNKKKKSIFTKLEKFIYKSSFVIAFILIIGIVFTSASVSKLNIELQDINKKIQIRV